MKIFKYILVVMTFVLGVSACDDEFYDVNVPSNAVDVEQLRMSDLLAPIIHSTMVGQNSLSQSTSNYVQYMVGQGGGATGYTEAAGLWNEIYLYILPNIETLRSKAIEEGAVHYQGLADILTAINLATAADTWDNIPYSQASMGVENAQPSFDSQEDIYAEVMELLDSGIALLNQSDNSGKTPGSEDLIYRGNIGKWIKAAHTLKARYQLRLMSKGVLSPSQVLSTIGNGMNSNDQNFFMFYDDRNLNPWYTREVVARSTGNFHNDIAEQFVSSLNGDFFPFQDTIVLEDPRLRVFIDDDFNPNNEIADTMVWVGFISGGGGAGSNGLSANTFFAGESFYTSEESPLLLVSYAESEFIKAEVGFLANGGTTTSTGTSAAVYDAYLSGIQASMNMFGVNGSEYLADPAIAVGASNLRLEHIMKEKYINNFLNVETFADFRRYDFSNNVFRGLKMREGIEDEDPEFAGQWFRRADYPSSERNRNSANVAANEQSVVTPVWWDQ